MIILIGHHGYGKTILAKRMPSILPPLCLHKAFGTTKIHSVTEKLDKNAGLVTWADFVFFRHFFLSIS